MKKISHTLTCILLVLLAGGMKAQLSGVLTVPGTYTSIGAAINDLNTQGVNGAVTVNIAAGYTETAVAGGYTLNAITGASASNQITFQKSGTGANPIIYAYSGGTATPASALQDGIWKFNGTDFVTIDGIDLTDLNTANPATMEYGYGFFKASVTDGCQNNTVKNCVITLNRINSVAGSGPAVAGSRGIDMVNATIAAHATALTITNATGSNSNNKFYSNTIQNCQYGIALIGFAAATPFTLADTGNDIGGSALSTGNTIINFGGGGTLSSAGVITTNQYGINVAYNTINSNNGSGVSHAGEIIGVFVGAALSANSTISSNTVTLKCVATTNQLTGILNTSGSTAASNSITITNNLVTNCTYTSSTSGSFVGIINGATPATLSIVNNTVSNNSYAGGSGVAAMLGNNAAVGSVININNNTVAGFTVTGTMNGSLYGIANQGAAATATTTIDNNTISGITYIGTTSSGVTMFIQNTGTAKGQNITNNKFDNLSITSTGELHVINSNNTMPANGVRVVSNNSIITGLSKSGGSTVYGYYSYSTSPPTVVETNANNNFSNIRVFGTTVLNVWFTQDGPGSSPFGPSKNVTANTFTNITSETGAITALIIGYSNTGSAGLISGNLISNITCSCSIKGIEASYGNHNVYSNSVSSFTTHGSTSVINGIHGSNATTQNLYKNKIYDLYGSQAGASIFGMNMTAGVNTAIYNNIIGDLRMPVGLGANPINGMSLTGGTNYSVSFNSVYLNAASSGSLFGSSALNLSTSPTSVILRNNIFVNNSTASGAGIVAAFRKSSTSLTNYAATSNNNLFYAGTPSSNNLIYWDGTNVIPTISAYKILMATRDQLSVSENPPFISTVASNPAFLTVSTSIPTQIESGAAPVAGITDDYAGTVRNVTTPDIGAYEGTYVVVPACSGVPAAALLASSAAAVCPTVSFNVLTLSTYTNAGISYQWMASTTSSNTGFSAVSDATTTVLSNTNLATTTWYQLAVTCANSGSVSTSAPIMVTLGAPTLSAVSNATVFCAGQSINLSIAPSAAGLTYQWMASSTNSSSGYAAITNATLSTLTNTTGIVGNNWYESIVACSANTSYSTATIPVQVLQNATPTATASASSNTICYNASFDLIGGTDIGTTFSWTGPNSYTSSVQSPTGLTYTAGGSASYNLVTTLNGCSSAVANVVVNSLGVFSAGVPAATPTAICSGATTTLQLTPFTSNVNAYTFATSTGAPLLTLPAPVIQVVTGADDTPSAPFNIGFTFNFNGVDYTQAIVSPDGWLRFGGTTGTDQYINSVTSTANTPKLYPYWDDMHTGTNGNVSSQLLGSAPNRTLVIQWFVTIPYNDIGAANSTFQALLVEGSNTVEFRYGTMGSSSMSASSGLTASGSNFNSITISNNTNSTSSGNNSNSGQPASGRSYLFTPPVTPTYTWAPGAILSSTSASSVTSSPTISTTYSLILTHQGCVTTRTVPVIVSNTPTVNISTTNTNVCSGTSATLTASGANTYLWNTTATTSAIVVSPTMNTTYTVTGTSGVCPTASQVITLNASQSPVVTIGGSSGICTGQTATLTASGAPSFSWNTGSTNATITDMPMVSTTYTVTGTDALGCSTTTTQLVNVATGLNIQIAGPSTICIGQPANLTASGGVTYTWSTNETTAAIAPTPVVNTTYSVVGASGTCSNSAVMTVSVIPIPTITLVATANTVCANSSVTLTAGGGNTYTWSTSSNATVVVVTPTSTTSYTVTGTNTVGCSVSTVVTINTNTLPIVAIAQTSTLVCATSPVTLTASGATTYTWSNSGPVNAINVVNPTANTVYTVTGTNPAGCIAVKQATVNTNSLPVITIAPATPTICATNTLNLTASGAGTGGTYTWTGGPATSTYVVSPANSTTYTVIGTNTNNCVGTKTVAVVTNSLPVLSIAPAVSQTVCSQAGATFTASGAATYTWSGNASFFANVAYFPSVNTTYTVTGNTTSGCSSTATVAISTLTLPVVTLVPATSTVCIGSSQTFTADGAVSYSWANNASTAITATYAVTTPTSIIVTGTGPNGCNANATALVFTNALPVVAIEASSSTICALSPVTFTATGANTYSWNTGASNSVVTVNPANSSVVYTVTGTDALGCSNTETISVVANALPAVSITPASTVICRNTTVALTAAGAVSYAWAHNGSINTLISVTPTTTTTYSVTGTDALGCVNSGTATVTVNQLPTVVVTPATATICSENGSVTFTATGAPNYVWSSGNVTTDTFVATPSVPTSYTVTGTDANNCVGRAIVGVEIDPCTGIKTKSFSGNDVSVYPNPSTGVFTAKFEFEGTKTITIINSVGQLISETTTANTSETFNLSGVAKGVYFVKVSTSTASGNYKLIIE